MNVVKFDDFLCRMREWVGVEKGVFTTMAETPSV
jgi:hypothetical protein